MCCLQRHHEGKNKRFIFSKNEKNSFKDLVLKIEAMEFVQIFQDRFDEYKIQVKSKQLPKKGEFLLDLTYKKENLLKNLD